MKLPRYPVYVPSKGRHHKNQTARFLVDDGVPFHLVVEPQEEASYRKALPDETSILVLPFRDLGSVIPARNWIKQHATQAGYSRHWQLDDNARHFYRLNKGQKIPCNSALAFRVAEDFADRYENVAIIGLEYDTFLRPNEHGSKSAPFTLNTRVYSCSLILNSLPFEWRHAYNEDTDMCLQVLSAGWCTVLINAFAVAKSTTMTMKGGNMSELYKDDGRLKMARSLERLWPGVVTISRRFKRPQHSVNWSYFTTSLKLKKGIDLSAIPKIDEYGMKLTKVKEIKSPELQQFFDEHSQ